MSTLFPTSLDDFENPEPSTSQNEVRSHSQQHGDLNDAVEALEAKVGINGSADVNSLDYKVGQAGMFQQAGASTIQRTMLAKARETVSLLDFSASVSQTGQLNSAVSNGKEFMLPAGDYTVTAFANDLGIPVYGDGRLLKNITGGQQQLNSRADEGQHVFGQEYLSTFHKIILNKEDLAGILMSGDSTTFGDGATSPYRIWEQVKILGTEKGHEIEVVNAGHSGEDTDDWDISHVVSDVNTYTPALYIVRWGINDPFFGRSISQFATSLRSGLAKARALKDLSQMSILLMAPNSTSDTPNDRDERWYEQARLVCRQAARDFQCCYIDTYALWKDSRPAAGLYMDDPFADGRAIHPANVMNAWIGSKISEVIFPSGLRPRMFDSAFGTLAAATLPNRYPYGQSIFSGGVGASDFGVTNCTVVTKRSANGAVYQLAHSNIANGASNGNYPVPQIMERIGLAGAWYTPHTEPSLNLTSLLTAAGTGWVPFVASTNEPRAKKTNNTVTLNGLIKSGTTAATTVLFTLPVGYRPRNSVEAFLCAMGPTGTTTPCVIHVTSAGVATLQSTGNAAFVSLSGISFEVGG